MLDASNFDFVKQHMSTPFYIPKKIKGSNNWIESFVLKCHHKWHWNNLLSLLWIKVKTNALHYISIAIIFQSRMLRLSSRWYSISLVHLQGTNSLNNCNIESLNLICISHIQSFLWGMKPKNLSSYGAIFPKSLFQN